MDSLTAVCAHVFFDHFSACSNDGSSSALCTIQLVDYIRNAD